MNELNGAPTISRFSQTEYLTFCDFFYRETGIHFTEAKRYYVDKRLDERLEACGESSLTSYVGRLKSRHGREEVQHLINLMTVNETYFFRERAHFECLVDSVLDELVELRGRHHTLRLWGVPCSTGEEPYSIALYVLERWPHIDSVDLEIVASDIDTSVLAKCERAIFSERSVQYIEPALRAKYFHHENGQYALSRDVVSAVHFCRANLVEPNRSAHLRGFDVVFCRNLFIYFDDRARRLAAQTIFDALAPGGFLFLGQMESIGRVSGLFEIVRRGDCVVYRKPL